MTTKKPEPPTIPFASRDAWEAWLEGQHATTPEGLWLKIAKKGSGIESVSYGQAVEVALCYGWIDGQARGFDEDYYLQRFTPRRPRSKWSKVNRKRVTKLTNRGEMQAAGLRGGGAGQGRRPVGRRLRLPELRHGAGRPAPGAGEERKGSGVLLRARRTAGTGTPSCTRSRMPRDPRRGRGASSSTWRCWPSKRSSTPETIPKSCPRRYVPHGLKP
jgi:hypothetical protein